MAGINRKKTEKIGREIGTEIVRKRKKERKTGIDR